MTLKGHVNAPKIAGRFNVGGGAAIHITDVLGDITATGDDDGDFAITANVVEGNVDLSKGRGIWTHEREHYPSIGIQRKNYFH